MTYDRLATYLTWGGTIGTSGAETWQTGVHLGLSPSLDAPGLPTVVELEDLITTQLAPFHSATANYISPGASLTFAKAAVLDGDGHYTSEPVVKNVTAVPGGGSAPNKGAPQLSMCITLWSGQSLGRANFGRLYMPWWEAGVGNDGRVLAGLMAPIVLNASDLVLGINAWAAAALAPSAQIRIMSKLGSGASKVPAFVRVGDIKDTQQRRRRQLKEQYSVAPV